jgi:hypothetical protein
MDYSEKVAVESGAAAPHLSWNLTAALAAAREPLLFGIRLWVSVCLALFVAFWLQLDEPNWAGMGAAIACLPVLGASLRKGWFLMIGTVVGATMIVVLTALFPQDRIAFLGLLAVWGGICAFAATLLHNYASYAAACAGFTAAIVAGDNLGATGGASPDVFMVAVTRARDRVRRHRPRRDRFRRHPAAARSVIRQSGGRDRGPIYPHAGTGGAATAGHANRATRARPARHRARPDDRQSAR